MAEKEKINVLVIPDLFPKFPGDLQGIFILDYLKSTAEYCNNSVLFLKLTGPVKGFSSEQTESAHIFKYIFNTQKIVNVLKPFYYLLLFAKGYQMGSEFKGAKIIHAHGSIISGTLAYFLSRKLNVPFVISEHLGPFSVISGSKWKKHWARFVMEKAGKVLAVSGHLKSEIKAAGINPRELFVTYNPVDTDLFKLRPAAENNQITFAGRLDNFKGAFRCLKAFDEIADEFPEWTFTIIGDGEDLAEIKNYLDKKPTLKNKITLTGSLTKADIAENFKRTSFFVFPSRHESFGLVIAEALACGVPVIAGKLTAPKEYVNANNGLLVDPDSIDEIKDAMRTLIKTHKFYDPDLIRGEIVQRFGFDKFGKSLTEIYLDTITKH